MIEVAVIGAGQAGLVTAKHLLASGLRCCVFEASSTLGGAWSSGTVPVALTNPSDSAAENISSPMWKGLRTNLSKHTCRFSDFPWPEDTPTFPSQEDMDLYLKAYANEFLLNEETSLDETGSSSNYGVGDPPCSFLFDCRVTGIYPTTTALSSSVDQKYKVEWTDSVAQTKHSKEFGGIVLATGFFSKPSYPSGLPSEFQRRSNQDQSNADGEDKSGSRKMEILHSKDYSSHDQFSNAAQKIAVVGSSHSALEIATDLTKSAEQPITVIMPKIPWVVPRYVPASASSSNDGFLPLDLVFYQRTHDFGASGHATETTVLTPETCQRKHEHLRKLLGPRQDRILPVPRSSFEEPPLVAISDLFLDLVADGKIEVLNGRLEGLTKDGTGLEVSQSKSSDGPKNESDDETDTLKVVSDVTSLIVCTGYSPDLESFCGNNDATTEEDESSSILDTIQYNPTDLFSPMTTHLETLHPELPNFAFVGMYRGPYMGVVELQAKLASEYLSGKTTLSEQDFEKGLGISKAIRYQIPSLRPQFPRFDYVGFMDSLAGSLSSSSGFPAENTGTGDMVNPAFYQSNPSLVEAAKAELKHEIKMGRSGKHLPAVVVSALVGNWSFERDILHFASGGKSIAQRQYIHGTVNYSRSKDHGHIVYREDGLFEISPTKSLSVFREYDYLCTGDNDESGGSALELYFREGGERTYLFLNLKFQHRDKDGYWVASNDHLCVKDLYKATFRIKLDGLAASEVIITYRVQGPAKNYESTTTMRSKQ